MAIGTFPPSDTARGSLALVLPITLLAVALRLPGLGWGAPYVYHPDEHQIVEHALQMVRTGDPNPRWFLYPTAQVYLQAATSGILARLTGADTSPVVLQGSIYAESVPSHWPHYFSGRLLVAVLGGLSAAAVTLAGFQLAGPVAGGTAGLVLSLSPLHVGHSQYVTTDVPSAFWVALTLLAVALYQRGWGPGLVAAAIASGPAASTKYNAGLVAMVPPLVAWQALGRPWHQLLALSAFSLFGFLAGSPFVLAEPATFWRYLGLQAGVYSGGHAGATGGLSWLWYAGRLATQGLTPPLFLAWVASTVWVLWRGGPTARAAATYGLLYLLLVGSFPVRFSRNLIPLLPATALVLGLGTAQLVHRSRLQLVLLALVLAFLPPLLQVRAQVAQRLRPDTRSIALDWVRAILPPGTTLARETGTPPVTERDGYRVKALLSLPELGVSECDLAAYDYLIASEFEYARYLASPEEFPDLAQAYQAYFGLPLVAEFEGGPNGSPGPRVALHRVSFRDEMAFTRPYYGVSVGMPSFEPLRREHRLTAVMGGFAELAGYSLRRGADGQVTVDLVWHALDRPPGCYKIFVHLLDAGGQRVAQHDGPPAGGARPTTRWVEGEWIEDAHTIQLPRGAQWTHLIIGLYDENTLERVRLANGSDHLLIPRP